MHDTIAAISTAQGVGAISIIRVSGPNSFDVVSKIFSNKKLMDTPSHTILYGFIYDHDKKIDEVLVSVMRKPKTYTREAVIEINAHGGISTTNKILELLLENGARLAKPGEFTERAFLNGRIDLTEAEAVMDVINSKTDSARDLAINQLSGKASDLIRSFREELSLILANIEVNLNYPEYDDIEDVTTSKIRSMVKSFKEKIDKIVSESKNGSFIKSGINTVIVGKPNVGKSSLLNRLIGEEKAIVTDIQGTTRDTVESSVVHDNIILNFIDTAGIRKTSNKIEKIGVDKSISLINKSDLILFVIDGSKDLTDDDLAIFDKIKDKNYICVVNKSDLGIKADLSNFKNYVIVSAYKDQNISSIFDKIKDIFNLGKIETSDMTYLTSARSLSILKDVQGLMNDVENSLNSGMTLDVIEVDLKSIWNKLGDIIGENYSEELLDTMFSNFCLGK